jgi:hypothetical protein
LNSKSLKYKLLFVNAKLQWSIAEYDTLTEAKQAYKDRVGSQLSRRTILVKTMRDTWLDSSQLKGETKQ